MTNPEKKIRWNKTRVLSLAAGFVDSEGLAALTLTRLADTMGVRPPSLFNHVDSLAGLIRDLALLGTSSLAECLENVGTPASLEQMMNAYRSFVREHPGLYSATLALPRAQAFADPELSGAENRILEACLKVAKGFGLEGQEALHTLRTWRALAHGFSDLERQGGFGLPLDLDETYRRAVAALRPGVQR